MLKIISILLLAAYVYGQPAGLTLVRTTHQQYTLAYRSPTPNPCTIDARGPGNTPLNDTNPALFANADKDMLRPSTVTNGLHRTVVIGSRSVETAADMKRYSRSAQTATSYVNTITCEDVSLQITATTQTIPFGPNLWDEWPYRTDAGFEGYYQYPTKSLTTRETFIDHRTGAELKTLTLPPDTHYPTSTYAITWGTGTGTGWTNPAAAAGTGGSVAEYAGTTNEWLFVPGANDRNNGSGAYTMAQGDFTLRAEITGNPLGADRNAEVCIGNLTVGCRSGIKTLNITTCSITVAQGQCVFGSSTNFDSYWKDGDYPMDHLWRTASGYGLLIRKVSTSASHVLRIDGMTGTLVGANILGLSTNPERSCSPTTTTYNSRQYYICNFQERLAQNSWFYSVDAETRVGKYLGAVRFSGENTSSAVYSSVDPKIIYYYGGTAGRVIKCSFNGNLTADYAGGDTKASTTNCAFITSAGYNVKDMVAAFYPGYNAGDGTFLAGASLVLSQTTGGSDRLVFRVSYGQDYLGWIIVFDPHAIKPSGAPAGGNEGNVIAARKVGLPGAPQWTKACALHGVYSTSIPNVVQFGCSRWDINMVRASGLDPTRSK
jgi:hypothetical protein